MKKNIILLVLISIIPFSSCKKEKKIDFAKEKAKIETVLEQYNLANENQDFELIKSIWANDESIVCIGTDTYEKLVGWKQIKPVIQSQYKSFKETYISVNDQIININKTGNTAWFSEILEYNFIYKGVHKSFEGIRYTGVLTKTNDKWLLVQTHMSIPKKSSLEEN
ncbi:MAG: nuclear transport factor 2 family protein [Bacteroidales bacterium]|nr:nuclear transport factor 2 family protein [Bacteroidales bacterium]